MLEQAGRVYWFENRPDVTEDEEFLALDLRETVRSPRPPREDGGEEEGLLGLAFHPDFRENGHLFLHYTAADEPRRGVIRGDNLGWPWLEGLHEFHGVPDDVDPAGLRRPVVSHPHPEMQCIIGGYVYRGRRLPQLRGDYVYGDDITGRLWRLRYEDSRITRHEEFGYLGNPTSFGEDRDGEPYVTSFDGRIYTFAAGDESP